MSGTYALPMFQFAFKYFQNLAIIDVRGEQLFQFINTRIGMWTVLDGHASLSDIYTILNRTETWAPRKGGTHSIPVTGCGSSAWQHLGIYGLITPHHTYCESGRSFEIGVAGLHRQGFL